MRGLSDEELYDQLSGWQESPGELRQQQTAQQLRFELEKLEKELEAQLEQRAAAQREVLAAQAAQQQAAGRQEGQLQLVRRQLQSLKRGTTAASSLAERCRECQRRAELLDLEREALEKEAQIQKRAWQERQVSLDLYIYINPILNSIILIYIISL